MLTRDQILAAQDTRIEKLLVPEWGGEVFVRTMTGYHRDIVESELRKPESRTVRAKIAAFTVCDESGNLLFTEKDIAELGKKNYSALDRILVKSYALNEIGEDAIDDLKKTLKETTGDGSSSG